MQHDLKIFFCKNCYEKLANTGEAPTDLYESICAAYLLKGPLIYDAKTTGKTNTLLGYLEKHAYIVSTDIYDQKNVLIRPAKYLQINGDHFFCACKQALT